MLEYSWRDFYRRYYQPAKGIWNVISLLFTALELVSVEYSRTNDRDQFEFSLERIRQRLRGDSTLSIDEELAGFLSLEPWFLLTQDAYDKGLNNLLAGLRPLEQPTESSERSHTVPLSQLATTSEPPIRKIERLMREGRLARSIGDLQALWNSINEAQILMKEYATDFVYSRRSGRLRKSGTVC